MVLWFFRKKKKHFWPLFYVHSEYFQIFVGMLILWLYWLHTNKDGWYSTVLILVYSDGKIRPIANHCNQNLGRGLQQPPPGGDVLQNYLGRTRVNCSESGFSCFWSSLQSSGSKLQVWDSDHSLLTTLSQLLGTQKFKGILTDSR